MLSFSWLSYILCKLWNNYKRPLQNLIHFDNSSHIYECTCSWGFKNYSTCYDFNRCLVIKPKHSLWCSSNSFTKCSLYKPICRLKDNHHRSFSCSTIRYRPTHIHIECQLLAMAEFCCLKNLELKCNYYIRLQLSHTLNWRLSSISNELYRIG